MQQIGTLVWLGVGFFSALLLSDLAFADNGRSYGAGRGAIVARRTKAISATARSPSAMVMGLASPFDQRHAAVVEVHDRGRRQADDEVDEHRDGHDLDGLACLVEHGAREDLHQVRVTDCNRQ